MVSWFIAKLKWLLLICAVGGPVVALACWHDGIRRQEVLAQGLQADAAIESATRVKRRRGGTSYKLALSWMDAGGLRHEVEEVSISHEFARQIIVDDRLIATSLPIKYMPATQGNDPRASAAENLIILADTASQEQTDQELIYVGAGAGTFGLIGSALVFLPRRRKREIAAA